jgi:hypothetical protein
MEMTKARIRELRTRLETQLSEFSRSLGEDQDTTTGGMVFEIGTITYRDQQIRFTVIGNAVDQLTGEVFSQEADDFKRYSVDYEVATEALGMRFIHRGEEFTLTGLKRRRRKYPFSAVSIATGKSYKFPVHVIKRIAPQP